MAEQQSLLPGPRRAGNRCLAERDRGGGGGGKPELAALRSLRGKGTDPALGSDFFFLEVSEPRTCCLVPFPVGALWGVQSQITSPTGRLLLPVGAVVQHLPPIPLCCSHLPRVCPFFLFPRDLSWAVLPAGGVENSAQGNRSPANALQRYKHIPVICCTALPLSLIFNCCSHFLWASPSAAGQLGTFLTDKAASGFPFPFRVFFLVKQGHCWF